MQLVVVHYHYRPGGVRRVVELGLTALVEPEPGRWHRVVLAGGEAPEEAWLEDLRARCSGVPVQTRVDPALGYATEQPMDPGTRRRRLRHFWRELFANSPPEATLVWAHNLGLGRNVALSEELTRACGQRGIQLVSHHHDWWFEHRWHRWVEFRTAGATSLARLADTVFSTGPEVRHAVINRRDAALLRPHLGARVGWLPNPVPGRITVAAARVQEARRWLSHQCGLRGRPVWLVPCRLLRRKNLAEALLLTRWLRPEAWLVTTGAVSSAEEEPYACALEKAAHRHGWPLRLAVLARARGRAPDVYAVMRASEAIVLTSVQEGFGLPYLEAATVQRPLVARAVPTVVPDLKRMGFQFPQLYREVWVPTDSFDWPAERQRQLGLFLRWRQQLPRALRAHPALNPKWLSQPAPPVVPFSSLTLTGQLEILAQPPERSWEACLRYNPWLRTWQRRVARDELRVTPWPDRADRWLGLRAYAHRFWQLVRSRPRPAPCSAPQKAQASFLEKTLAEALRHPILWAPES